MTESELRYGKAMQVLGQLIVKLIDKGQEYSELYKKNEKLWNMLADSEAENKKLKDELKEAMNKLEDDTVVVVYEQKDSDGRVVSDQEEEKQEEQAEEVPMQSMR